MYNREFIEFILENLIKAVNKGTFDKEFGNSLAGNYYIKKAFTDEDMDRYMIETGQKAVEEAVDETVGPIENINETEEVEEPTEETENVLEVNE